MGDIATLGRDEIADDGDAGEHLGQRHIAAQIAHR